MLFVSLLDDTYGLPPHDSFIDHRGAPVVSYKNMKEFDYFYNYTVHHREPYQISMRLYEMIQKMSRIHEYLDAAMVSPVSDTRLYANQFYIQLQNQAVCLLSFPPALHIPEEWSEVIDGYRTGDLTQHEMYRKVLRLKQPHFNFLNNDIETNSKQVMTVL